MTIFLSGAITGVPDYRDRFASVADKLTKVGHIVLNPAMLPDGLPYEDCMRVCMTLIDHADAVAMLSGWENSPGANREYGYALALNKLVVDAKQLTKEDTKCAK